MRKIIAIGFIIAGVFISCQKEEITPTKPIVSIGKKCDCDRVYEIYEWMSNGVKSGKYITKNDCSGIEKEGNWQNIAPYIGECKN